MVVCKRYVTLFLLLVSLSVTGQDDVNRYVVYLSDKANSPYTVDDPEAFLSERSILRKQTREISITESDLPVNPGYLQALSETGIEVYFSSRWTNSVLVQMTADKINEISNLSFVNDVVYVAKGSKLTREMPNYSIPATFDQPWIQTATSDLQLQMLGADSMHLDGYTGKGMLIAVLDGGFEGANKFLPLQQMHREGRFLGGRDFITNSYDVFQFHDHGTAVLSCIAAEYDRFYGTGHGAEFLLLVTEDVSSEYRIEEYNWLLAAEFADSAGADIINSSLGYSTFNSSSMNYTYADLNGQTALVSQAAKMALDKGMVVVVSAGNEGNSNWKYITPPADVPGVIAVGSITSEYKHSHFSSFGPTSDRRVKPDVVALGSSTTLMGGDGGIYTASGTSFAAPLIAGLAAGIWQANPHWSNYDVTNAIRQTASLKLLDGVVDANKIKPDSIFGYGLPSYPAAYGYVLSVEEIVNTDVSVYPNPFTDNKVYLDISGPANLYPLSIRVYDTRGILINHTEITNRPFKNIIELDVQADLPGVYFLVIMSDQFVKRIKLLKQ